MAFFPRQKIGLQGRWPFALLTLLLPIFFIFSLRWFFYEPFVIPSESMMPSLMVHDHILVKKYQYGLKPPLGDGWLVKWRQPERGDVIVFRYPDNREVFFIKRLIGLPGDRIVVQNGQISINGKPWVIQPLMEGAYTDEGQFNYFLEEPNPTRSDEKSHNIRLSASGEHVDPDEKIFVVPKNSYFAMGDNRDQSHDSRFWGFIPEELLVGRAQLIWLSCAETLASAPFICDPRHLRLDRFLKTIE